ncbi:MAG: metal ABC transporter permease [Chloroflexota bacterium]
MAGWAADFTTLTVLAGAVALGIAAGALGCFTTLRRQSLLGDALAHAALPGVCAGFLAAGAREPLPLLIGAIGAGVLAILWLLLIVRRTRVKEDAALGIVLTVSFGVGAMMLTAIQHGGDGAQAGLDRFLFGQAATLLPGDVVLMAALAGAVLAALALAFKELQAQTFDPGFAAASGLPSAGLSAALGVMTAVVTAIGLQAVGAILMVSLLVAPAVAARQWTRSLPAMTMLAAAFGALSAAAGVAASAAAGGAPTGPAIVLAATALALISLLFAPGRGILAAAARRSRERRAWRATAGAEAGR